MANCSRYYRGPDGPGVKIKIGFMSARRRPFGTCIVVFLCSENVPKMFLECSHYRCVFKEHFRNVLCSIYVLKMCSL